MSNFSPLDEQYPNQLLGVSANEDTNAGAVNQMESPLILSTRAGVTGSIFNSGAAQPGISGGTASRVPGNVGDYYFRTAGTGVTAIYRCIVAGSVTSTTGMTGSPVWQELL